jgi:hypothetical protein
MALDSNDMKNVPAWLLILVVSFPLWLHLDVRGVEGAETGGVMKQSMGPPPKWMTCVHQIHRYFTPINATEFYWKKNDCGFRAWSYSELKVRLSTLNHSHIPNGQKGNQLTYSFIGDSTAIRCFIHAWNSILNLTSKIPFQKVAAAPPFMETAQGATPRLRYFRLMYISLGEQVLRDAIATSNGGMILIVVGNWDLNWKIQVNTPMPGLVGGVHNFTAAQEYWVTYVDRLFHTIREVLQSMDPPKRPLILIREQMLPNCDASRFVGKKRRYRQCQPLVRPIVVPLYRRTLAGVAWSLGIPVIPVDELFQENYKFCGLSDGLHLDFPCHDYEQQLVWNSYFTLLVNKDTLNQGTWRAQPVSARDFLNESVFADYFSFLQSSSRAPSPQSTYVEPTELTDPQSSVESQPSPSVVGNLETNPNSTPPLTVGVQSGGGAVLQMTLPMFLRLYWTQLLALVLLTSVSGCLAYRIWRDS